MTATRIPSAALTRFVVGSRYMPVYLALLLLVVVAAIWVPATLSGPALSAIAPFGALLGIVALGQMLVIMTGGIDLSVPGTITISALIMVGVSQQSDTRAHRGRGRRRHDRLHPDGGTGRVAERGHGRHRPVLRVAAAASAEQPGE
jgi:ribose/xylose/arabinose/galactoside ABC-type transport system permease subunit